MIKIYRIEKRIENECRNKEKRKKNKQKVKGEFFVRTVSL